MGDRLIFKAKNICKSFGPTKALVDVDIELWSGEIHGLIGENGSGKSTLCSIIAAAKKADSGTMELYGEAYKPGTVPQAIKSGVSMVVQEEGTFSSVSVSANMFAGREGQFSKCGILSVKKMNREARKALDAIGAKNIKEDEMVSSLSFEDCKMLELARSLYIKPDLLIIDETSAALSKEGRSILYNNMQRLKDEGHCVLFIAHDIDELIEMSDRITILRDGARVTTLEKQDFCVNKIKELMIGRSINSDYYITDTKPTRGERVALEVDGLYYKNLRDLSFKMYEGEILGIGGLSGCGMHDVGKILFGAVMPDLGSIKVSGKGINSPIESVKNKVAYLSKDRDKESLMKTMSIRDNICIVSLDKVKKFGCVTKKNERSFVKDWIDSLEIKMNNADQFVIELSGGNKQKVVLAKWMGFDPDVYIMDCPTRGIDIGIKAAVYEIIKELKKQGKAILIISEELLELIGMCDRVLILKRGKLSGEFERSEQLSERILIDYMI